MRPWLNWIERLATDQKVGGSSPPGRTIKKSAFNCGLFRPVNMLLLSSVKLHFKFALIR